MFTQKCFIRENTPLIRNKLESIGASICGCVEYGIGDCISFNKGIVHKFSFNFEYGETYKPTILKEIENFIDCYHNEDLFIAICSLRDDSEINQFFVLETTVNQWSENCKPVGSFVKCVRDKWFFDFDKSGNPSVLSERNISAHKATVEELINHFNK